MEASWGGLGCITGHIRRISAPTDLWRKPSWESGHLACRTRVPVSPTALAYPQTLQRFQASKPAPDASEQATGNYLRGSASSGKGPVTYMGPEEKVAGHMLFMHLCHDCTLGQVVALCNELVGRVPGRDGQAVRAHLRPISLSTPAGRFDWDPVGEELPAHMWTLLGAPAQQLKLRMLTVSVSSDADLAALRQHVAGIVDYIQHGEDHRGLSAAF